MIRKNLLPLLVILCTAGVIASCSGTSSPLLSNAESAIQSQNYDSAETAASQYIQENPQNPLGYYWKGIALGQKAQDQSIKQETPQQANAKYKNMQDAFGTSKQIADTSDTKPGELQRIDPFLLSLWRSEHNRAVKLATDDSLKQTVDNPLDLAIGHLNNAIIIEPDSSLSWGVLAQINGMQGNYGDAAKAQQKFVDLKDSVDTKAYLLLAQYYRRNEEPKKAIQALEDVRQKDPDNTQVVEILADSYSDEGESDKAISMVEDLVKKNPNEPRYHLFLGNRIYQAAMKYQDKYEDNIDKIMDLQQKQRNASGSDAQDLKNQIQDLKQKNEDLKQQNDQMTERAINQLKQVTQSQPDKPDAYNTLGIIYQNKAAVLFEKRNITVTDNQLAKQLDDEGKDKLTQAMQYYEKAAQIDPDNKKYWRSLFQVYTSLGMDKKADEAEKKAGMQ